MIITRLIPRHGTCSLLVESPDDLWTLRRLIEKGDTVVTKTSRVVKREEEYARPDKGERIRVTVALLVENVALDSSVDRLRLRGKITETTDESVSKAGVHSVTVSPGDGLTVRKENWTPLHNSILNSSKNLGRRFLLIAIDRREAGIGILSGSHLSLVTTVDSGASGKRFKQVETHSFMKKMTDVLRNSFREGDAIVVAGPGNTKLELANLISSDPELGKGLTVLEGFDLAGSDGVRALIKFDGLHKVAADSVLVEVQGVVNEVIRRIARGDARVAYTVARVGQAADSGAVESCVVSDDVFSNADEDEVVSTLNKVERRGGRVYLADSSLELGKQVSSFGGIAATLRYSLKS